MDIKNRTALITGGASGLGAATVKRIVDAGGKVMIMDLQEEAGQKLTSELGENAFFMKCDVTSEEDVLQVI